MSSDDVSDDSGFDKEAEREKLREKYGQDDDRENTRRMSELLLQGATMTGKHCNQCSDPIFRYDGQEFCPNCQREAEGGRAGGANGGSPTNGSPEGESAEAGTAEGGSAESPSAASGGSGEPATGDGTAAGTGDRVADVRREDTDDEPRVEIEGVRVADDHVDRSNLRDPPSQQGGDAHAANSSGRGHSSGHERDSSRPARGRREHARDGRAHGAEDRAHRANDRAPVADNRPQGADDLGTARESLVRTLTDLSRRAEDTDDATHARELLAATREAAEALAALDRANR
ncbi:Sjogren's syndrome/scleroderma autoantigen 1 family protein [Halorussus litoreus]|uniref:Sjogren's syndrome/scleroderma autoantigen 1 family protein n=1 Tax=Halorussus litoreus TaxID=1710536 RepID=UPI000E24B390|nr:Sjogren's syndrome/scleroderma autoantigen 1 family protein [Halorussus litoreus]